MCKEWYEYEQQDISVELLKARLVVCQFLLDFLFVTCFTKLMGPIKTVMSAFGKLRCYRLASVVLS